MEREPHGPRRRRATTAMRVSPDYFEITGAGVALGRAIQTDDEHQPVALISHGLWQRRFGGASTSRQTLVLNGEAFTIVGVLRPDFVSLVRDADIVAPFSPATDPRRGQPRAGFLRVIARVKAGVTAAQAADDLTRSAGGCATSTRTRTDQTRRFESRRCMKRSAAAPHRCCGCSSPPSPVLLVACANIANLFLVRGAARRRELAVRAALGASRGRLVRQLLVEAAVIGVNGGALGVLVARALVEALVAIGPADLPRVAEIGIDLARRAFTLVVSLGAACSSASCRRCRRRAATCATGSRGATAAGAGGNASARRADLRGSRALDPAAHDRRPSGAQLPASAGCRSWIPPVAGPDDPALAPARTLQQSRGDRELL